MKPREKVVSAQDVESSLYYCHLTSEDDEALLQKSSQEELDPDAEVNNLNISRAETHEAGSIERTGDDASYRSRLSQPSSNNINESSSHNKHQIRRKPVIRQNSEDHTSISQHQTRKILGPRPLMDRPNLSTSSMLSSRVESGSFVPSKAAKQALTPVPMLKDMVEPSAPQETLASQCSDLLPSSKCITLIRRDPASKDQWNIGNLSLSGPRSMQSWNLNAASRNKDISIKLSATGYVKFAEQHKDIDRGMFERELKLSTVSDTKNGMHFDSARPSLSFSSPWQTSCTFQTAATGRALKCYHSLPESLVRSPAWSKHSRGPQSALISELRFNLPTLFEKGTAKKAENRRPISFQQYKTSRNGLVVGGRPISPDKSANIAGNGGETAFGGLAPSEKSPRTWDSAFNHRPRSAEIMSSHQSHLEDDTKNSSDETDTQLDLLLGQERAGGGFNGNKAKLGKLIIHGGQGFAMLDLLVAANMAIWFRDILEE